MSVAIMNEKETTMSEAQPTEAGHPEKRIEVSVVDDKALQFLAEHGTVEFSAADDKRVLRIIDRRLIPLMLFTIMLNWLDKNALSLSYNFGLTKDIPLTGDQYNWAAGSIFYLMYLIAQPIVARSLQIFPIGKFISISIIVWGILLTCTAACRSFASLMAVRALLGIVEACVNPAFMVLTAQWYKRDEQPERSGWWNLGLAGGQIFGGLIGYGVGHIKYRDYQPWMWFFIVFGCISTIWGVFLVYYLPDSPMDAKFLTVADRTIAVERVRENKTGIQNQLWKWYQFWECLRDPFTWFQFSIMVLGTVPSGGVSSFGSIVIKGFGFSSLNTTLLGMPLGLVQLISFVLAGRVTARWKNIRLHCSWISQVPPLIGAILLYKLPSSNKYGRLFSYYIFETHNIPFIFGMAMVSGNVAGFTKKTTVSAIMFIAYCAGQIAGPQVFREDQAPRYPTAFISNFVCFALIIAFIWGFQAYLMWQNWRRDRLVAAEGLDSIDVDENEGFHDRTDWEQKKTFRYVY